MNLTLEDIYTKVANGELTDEEAYGLILQLQKPESTQNITEQYIYNEPCLRDHLVNNKQVLLGVTYCSLAIRAFKSVFPDKTLQALAKVYFEELLEVGQDEVVEVTTNITEKNDKIFFESNFNKIGDTAIKKVCSGYFLVDSPPEMAESIDLAALKAQSHLIIDKDIYKDAGLVVHGTTFRTINRIYLQNQTALAEFTISKHHQDSHEYTINPAFLHTGIVAGLYSSEKTYKDFYVPMLIKEIRVLSDPSQRDSEQKFYCFSRLVKANNDMSEFDSKLCDANGKVLVIIKGISCKKITTSVSADVAAKTSHANVYDDITTSTDENKQEASTLNKLQSEIIKYVINNLTEKLPPNSVIDVKKNLMDLGISSINLIKLTKQIEKDAGIELYPTLFFEYPSIFDLSQYFAQEHTTAFKKLLNFTDAKLSELRVVPPTNVTPKKAEYDSSIHNKPTVEAANKAQTVTEKPASLSVDNDNDIAIIGMAGVYAGSPNLTTFWEHLTNQTDLINEIPPDHWDYEPWFDTNTQAPDKIYCKWGSFISDIDKFDAAFFNMFPVEAEAMDPQLRLLLQVMYDAVEDAGYAQRIRKTNTGVFVGTCLQDYMHQFGEQGKVVTPYDGTGNAMAMIANRPSFYFDLKGPSLTIDTACSSSLIALHLACQAIKENDCQMAFVAATTLHLRSWHYRLFCSLGALSPTGRCNTFDSSADGYVPGEGVAAILIKPLKKALADGDQIHAIIKGSAINHGGYTPSVTAPSVNQEAEVIRRAWQAAHIDPSTITYIEAHGTGTKLGDPVEIQAVKKAFGAFPLMNKNKFCGIGSVKANIGHTEGSAGITGLIKVILSMKHKQLPAMPTFKELNPLIELKDSPLYINQTLEAWSPAENIPRRAGISSFGFGGAYAHVVIEEAPDVKISTTAQTKPAYLMGLSAKTEKALKNRLLDLETWLTQQNSNYLSQPTTLESISYTLNIGREHFNRRCAIVVSSVKELQETLTALNHGEKPSNAVFNNEEKPTQHEAIFDELLTRLEEDVTKVNQLEPAVYQKKLLSLGDLYIRGYDINWQALHENEVRSIVSLPTYPFDKERYWFAENNTSEVLVRSVSNSLHPLLDANTSTLSGLQFSKLLTAQAFYLNDHRVQEVPMLPAAAYLEIARVGAALASDEKQVIGLRNIIWATPIKVREHPEEMILRLYPEDADVAFEIMTSKKMSGNVESITHAQGKIIYSQSMASQNAHFLDLAAIKKRCTHKNLREDIYNRYQNTGISYGPSFQVIEHLISNQTEVLAKIQLPQHLETEASHFVLHPSLLDGALQSIIGFYSENNALYLPFSIGQMDIYGPLPHSSYVYVTMMTSSAESSPKYNIQITDEAGKVYVSIKEFTVRLVKEKIATVDNSPVYYYQDVWESKNLSDDKNLTLTGPIVIFANDKSLVEVLREQFPEQVIIQVTHSDDFQEEEQTYHVNTQRLDDYLKLFSILKSKQLYPKSILYYAHEAKTEDIKKHLKQSFFPMFYLAKALMSQPLKEPVQLLLISEGTDVFSGTFVNALSGFAKTVSLEKPKIHCRIMTLAKPLETHLLLAELNSRDVLIHYDKSGQRFIKQYQEIVSKTKSAESILKKNGSYLITGGGGGLGLIFAHYLAKNYQAKLILIGRSELNEQQRTKLSELKALGSEVHYIRCDITKEENVENLLQKIHKLHAQLNGIIHCAGVLRDAFLLKKSEQDCHEVFSPKIDGTIYLDKFTKDEPLDFFVLFSSIAAVAGNIGQCDYAYANAWLDEFAKYRDTLSQNNKRHGKTVAIDWPLWSSGGMNIDKASQEWLETMLGLSLLSTTSGIEAFVKTLNGNHKQVIVIAGDKNKIDKFLLKRSVENLQSEQHQNKVEMNSTSNMLVEKIQETIITLLSKSFNIDVNRLTVERDLSEYGLDSIHFINLVNNINKYYHLKLTPTIVFKHSTINSLAKYIVEHHEIDVQAYYGLSKNITVDLPQKITSNDIVIEPNNSQHADRLKYLQFSLGQERLFFIEYLTPGQSGYNLAAAYLLTGPLQPQLLQQVCNTVISRHDSLRTLIDTSQTPWRPYLKQDFIINIQFTTCPEGLDSRQDEFIQEWIHRLTYKPYDFGNEPLLRLGLLKIHENKHIFLIACHHSIADAWSILLFIKEVIECYSALLEKRDANLPSMQSYYDFASRQRTNRTEQSNIAIKDFWKNFLVNASPILELPIDKSRENNLNPEIQSHRYHLSDQLAAKIRVAAQHHKCTTFVLMFSIYQVLLYHFSQQNSFIIGLPVLGREEQGSQNIIGYFVNTLPIPVNIDRNCSFSSFLTGVKETLVQAYANQNLPLSEILNLINIPRDLNREPLFQVMFNYLKDEGSRLVTDNLFIKNYWNESGRTPIDLTLEFQEEGGKYHVTWTYNQNLFEQKTIDRLNQHFENLLKCIIDDPTKSISNLTLLSPEETRQLIVEFNNTEHNYPENKTIHQLFEEQALSFPDRVAVVFKDEILTYRELNEKANQVSHCIRELGVQSGQLIPIYIERSIELIVGLLAILKADCAYVPLDPKQPKERIALILNDIDAKIALSEKKLSNKLPRTLSSIIYLDKDSDLYKSYPKDNCRSNANPTNLAYALYTSGTTGIPKGALITHQNVSNLIGWYQSFFHVTHVDKFSQFASQAFDVFGCEVWPALGNGASISLIDEEVRLDPERLFRFINEAGITICDLPSQIGSHLFNYQWPDNTRLRIFKLGGEKLAAYPPKKYPFMIWNTYGPTETTVESTAYELRQYGIEGSPLIGKPIHNMQAYILDDSQQLLPIGVIGELYLSGAGVGRGYLNRPELTNERFLANPFKQFSNKLGDTIYRTGDLCRWLKDGNIEYVGRVDDQVKIRGFRIELGEIESILRCHPMIKDVVVDTREAKPKDIQLVGYLVPKDENINLDFVEIKKYLKLHLPEYMVPAGFVQLKSLPLTVNCKINKKELPTPIFTDHSSHYQAPRDALESTLAKAWSTTLGIEKIGIQDDFFELGGHSLLAIVLINEIKKQTQITLPLTTIFQAPTISTMAELIRKNTLIQSQSPVIPLRSGGDNQPLFVIHPIGGQVVCYFQLAQQIDKKYPIYGIQQTSRLTNENNYSISDLATEYIDAIRSIQPYGPYYIAGWSLGGVIAHEIVYQLEQLGQSIGALVLIDSFAPLKTSSAPRKINEFNVFYYFVMDLLRIQHIDLEIKRDDFESLSEDKRWSLLLEKLKQAKISSLFENMETLQGIYNQFKANLIAESKHQINTIKSPIIIFYAAKNLMIDDTSIQNNLLKSNHESWNKFTKGGITAEYQIDADHYSMLGSPNAATIGGSLSDILNQKNLMSRAIGTNELANTNLNIVKH